MVPFSLTEFWARGPVSLVPDVSDFGLQRSTLPVVGSNPRTLKAAV